MGFVYRITNKINGKSYIGQTCEPDPLKRWRGHINESKKDRSAERPLYKEMNEFGVENFEFVVLEETDDPVARECYYIQKLDTYINGYNLTLGGLGKAVFTLSDELVCKTYKEQETISKTAELLECDVASIKKVLIRNGIHITSSQEHFAKERSLKVARLDPETGEILEVFDSVTDANRKYSASKHIGSVCLGKRQTCCGFGWKYIDS